MEQERIHAMQESSWTGRSGTLEAGPFGGQNSKSTPNLASTEQAPQSLRLKKKNTETLPPLGNESRIQSAPLI